MITTENQIIRFPSFVLIVFRDSASYCKKNVFCLTLMEPVKARARWWPSACLKSVIGLRRLEKTLKFLRCIHVFDRVLKYCSDINEGDWWHLLFYFIVLMGIVASVFGMIFFSCVSGFRLKFSGTAFWRKRLQLDYKSDLTTNGLLLDFFCWKMAHFIDFISVWTEICKSCSFVFFCFDDIKSFG